MSRDKTLKARDSLARHRNVLTRAERIEKMKDGGTWADDRSPLGLPKTIHRKVTLGGKAKKKAEETAEGEGEKSEATDDKKG